MQTDKKEKREFRLFLIYAGVLLLAISGFCMIKSHAEEVIVAEAPSNVGGNNETSIAGNINYISDGGSNQGVQSLAPNIIYAPSSDDGSFVISINSDPDADIDNSGEGNQSPNILYKASGSNTNNDNQPAETGEHIELDDIYVPDSDDDCPVSDKVPLPVELQEYLWTKCKKATGDYKNYYAFCLGVMEHESSFRPSATHHNSNGSTDRGIMQINSSNIGKMRRAGFISSAEDLYNAYKCIDCGVHMLNNYISQFGVSESAYYAYNTGRERKGSNKNSRIVMGYMSKWNTIIFG